MSKIVVKDRNGKRNEISANIGMTLMEIIRDAGMYIEAACGGCCACATCHIYVDKNSKVLNIGIGLGFLEEKLYEDGFEVYAKQISNLLEKNSSVLEELLNLLVIIAEADGKITNLEKIYLKEVSEIFGFSDKDFERICSSKLNKYIDPYQTLGVTKDTPLEKIKNKWKTLAMKHHPDRLIAQGIPQDIVETNTYRLKEINNAWDLIKNKKYDLNA